MAIITFDTCIFIAHKPSSFPRGFRMTAIVLQELTAGASDDKLVRSWDQVRRAREKDGTLLVPNGEDWWMAGKVLNSLLRSQRRKNKGKTPRISQNEKQQIIRDVLIARTAKRAGAMLVTDNLGDFKKIAKFCDVRLVSGKQYFGLEA